MDCKFAGGGYFCKGAIVIEMSLTRDLTWLKALRQHIECFVVTRPGPGEICGALPSNGCGNVD